MQDDRGDGAGGRLLRTSVGDVIAWLNQDEDGSGYRVMQFDEDVTIYLAIDRHEFWRVGNYTVTLLKNEDFLYGATDQLADELAFGYWEESGQRPARWNLGAEGELTVDLSQLNRAAEARARWATDAWSHASGITFVEVHDEADITFRIRGGSRSYADRTLEDGDLDHVEVAIPRTLIREAPVFGDEGCTAVLHELGHALGLGHPGPYNRTAVYGHDALYQNDTILTSALSYFDAHMDFEHRDIGYSLDAATPMPADLLALEKLYGPVRVNGGDTVYDASAFLNGVLGPTLTSEEAAEFDRFSSNRIVTIRDDRGQDRIDLSEFPGVDYTDKIINLSPGAVSSLGFYHAPAIRLHDGTVIEDLAGSRYRDVVTGNDAANRIWG